jgi:hypothetical protein
MNQEPEKVTYIQVSRPVFAPLLLAAISITVGILDAPWSFAALPFIYLGSFCAAPNFNLANGFLVLVSALAGYVVSFFHGPLGFAILLGSVWSWILSGIEMKLRAKPVR